jgi:hypothetical protein
MRGLRHRIEDARDECPAAVGLDDLDLEALARSERVGRRNGGMPPTLTRDAR